MPRRRTRGVVAVRLLPDTRRKLEKEARARNLTLSDIIRERIYGYERLLQEALALMRLKHRLEAVNKAVVEAGCRIEDWPGGVRVLCDDLRHRVEKELAEELPRCRSERWELQRRVGSLEEELEECRKDNERMRDLCTYHGALQLQGELEECREALSAAQEAARRRENDWKSCVEGLKAVQRQLQAAQEAQQKAAREAEELSKGLEACRREADRQAAALRRRVEELEGQLEAARRASGRLAELPLTPEELLRAVAVVAASCSAYSRKALAKVGGAGDGGRGDMVLCLKALARGHHVEVRLDPKHAVDVQAAVRALTGG